RIHPRSGVERILAPENLSLLEKAARSRELVLAFDYDGTLAPIVSDILKAQMRPGTARLLKQVMAAYPTAILSGRGYPDLRALLGGQLGRRSLTRILLIGSHGMQWGGKGKPSPRHER